MPRSTYKSTSRRSTSRSSKFKLSIFKLSTAKAWRRFPLRDALLRMHYGWREMGAGNQILLMLGFIFISTLSFTAYHLASSHYDMREMQCLALNIYHEARGESRTGQYAVATVTMNRVQSDRYPDDVCRVVYQKAWSSKFQRYISAFSWTDFDDKNSVIPRESKAWQKAFAVAKDVYLDNERLAKAGDALFYHADYVKPRWASHKTKIAKIGRHIFYH
jgi:N-acetylmuramoyl-L-alanine amidase